MTMQIWDHLILLDTTPEEIVAAGLEGWELVSASRDNKGRLTAFLKKPKPRGSQMPMEFKSEST